MDGVDGDCGVPSGLRCRSLGPNRRVGVRAGVTRRAGEGYPDFFETEGLEGGRSSCWFGDVTYVDKVMTKIRHCPSCF